MGDFGMKISETGENVNTSSLDETFFDSRYSSLILTDTQTITFTADAGDTDPFGTETYTHNLGYAPFIIANAEITSGVGVFSDKLIPYNATFPVPPPNPGRNMTVILNMEITTSDVDINWTVSEFLSGTSYALSQDCDFSIDLQFYGFELGYETS